MRTTPRTTHDARRAAPVQITSPGPGDTPAHELGQRRHARRTRLRRCDIRPRLGRDKDRLCAISLSALRSGTPRGGAVQHGMQVRELHKAERSLRSGHAARHAKSALRPGSEIRDRHTRSAASCGAAYTGVVPPPGTAPGMCGAGVLRPLALARLGGAPRAKLYQCRQCVHTRHGRRTEDVTRSRQCPQGCVALLALGMGLGVYECEESRDRGTVSWHWDQRRLGYGYTMSTKEGGEDRGAERKNKHSVPALEPWCWRAGRAIAQRAADRRCDWYLGPGRLTRARARRGTVPAGRVG